MYVGVGALDDAGRAQFQSLMPLCYTQEFADCWKEDNFDSYPDCAAVNSLWSQDEDWAQEVVNEVPYCSSVKMRDAKIIWASAAGLVGLVFGILASR